MTDAIDVSSSDISSAVLDAPILKHPPKGEPRLSAPATDPSAPAEPPAPLVPADFLTPGSERDALMQMHPLVLDSMIITTQSVRKMMTAIQQAITYRWTGMSFQAPPRHGKSRAITACTHLLKRHYPQLPVLMFSAKDHEVTGNRERTFYADRLEDRRHPAANSLRASTMRANLLNNVRSECDRKAHHVTLAIIDEAQNHTEKEFTYHKDLAISLTLGAPSIHMITCCVGQTELGYRIEDLVKKGRKDLLGRFFVEHEYLAGVCSEADLTDILAQFDDPDMMDYPERSGVGYTQFFFPKAYAAGWRLAKETRALWRVIVQNTPTEDIDIGMFALVAVLKKFMLENMHSDSPTFKGSEDLWLAALEGTPFRKMLNITEGA